VKIFHGFVEKVSRKYGISFTKNVWQGNNCVLYLQYGEINRRKGCITQKYKNIMNKFLMAFVLIISITTNVTAQRLLTSVHPSILNNIVVRDIIVGNDDTTSSVTILDDVDMGKKITKSESPNDRDWISANSSVSYRLQMTKGECTLAKASPSNTSCDIDIIVYDDYGNEVTSDKRTNKSARVSWIASYRAQVYKIVVKNCSSSYGTYVTTTLTDCP
jgi:hypothetical protein